MMATYIMLKFRLFIPVDKFFTKNSIRPADLADLAVFFRPRATFHGGSFFSLINYVHFAVQVAARSILSELKVPVR